MVMRQAATHRLVQLTDVGSGVLSPGGSSNRCWCRPWHPYGVLDVDAGCRGIAGVTPQCAGAVAQLRLSLAGGVAGVGGGVQAGATVRGVLPGPLALWQRYRSGPHRGAAAASAMLRKTRMRQALASSTEIWKATLPAP